MLIAETRDCGDGRNRLGPRHRCTEGRGKSVNKLVGPELGLLVITHYERLLMYIKPSHLHVLMDGKIVLSGGPELVKELERKGYDWVREKFGQEVLAV